MIKILALLIISTVLFGASQALENDVCNYKLFPVYAGGSRDEIVNCLTYDPTSEFFIVGGQTTSSNFAPAENPHGFVYALDTTGNWMWGNFFYNVSYSISEITGCKMSSKNSYITVYGQANQKPIIMLLNKHDGSISKFITVEATSTPDPILPDYETFQGIYYDEGEDMYDGKSYFYLTFLYDQELHLMRIANEDSLPVSWHYKKEFNVDNHEPNFLVQDPKKQDEMYWLGNMDGTGTIMKFRRRTGRSQFMRQFNDLNDISAWELSSGGNEIYGCGQFLDDHAAFFKMNSDGRVSVLRKIASTGDPLYCKGITINYEQKFINILLQSKEAEFNTIGATQYNTVLITIRESGTVISGRQVAMWDEDDGVQHPDQALFGYNEYLIFAGQTKGFDTRYQKQAFKDANDDKRTDVFVMKYLTSKDLTYNCLEEDELSHSKVRQSFENVLNGQVTEISTQELAEQRKAFAAYSSPFSGAFDLLDTLRVPRACAQESVNITQLNYHYGQKEKVYNIREQGYNRYIEMMNDEYQYIFQNGEDASDFGRFEKQNSKIYVQTNDENLVGTQRTLIRACDRLSNLIEVNFYVNVQSNSPPEFEEDLKTEFELEMDEEEVYKIPSFTDPEGNDESEVYINAMENQEFPNFVEYLNHTNTLKMKPFNKEDHQGRTFYFSVVLKEKNSDFMLNIYYITLRVAGDIYEAPPEEEIEKTEIEMEITEITKTSEGKLVFSQDVNMTSIVNNFDDIFKIYVQTVTKDIDELEEFEITSYSEEENSISFACKFYKPYLYGLLNKRDDLLTFEIKQEDEDDQTAINMILLNKTEEKIETTKAEKRIEMQFDFRNPIMKAMRQTAQILYFVMIIIVVAQFILLFIRNVGFLPLWTLIEYMQLVAFMPLYNFKLIPYLYDAFKPFLISHLIIFDESYMYKEMNDDYFNINYEHYWMPVAKLLQSLMNIVFLLVIVVVLNVASYLMSVSTKKTRFGDFMSSKVSQFKFNVYIRMFMLVYFSFTFFSIMKIIEGNNSTTMRQIALFFSYFFFVLAVVIPVFLITLIMRRFEVLKLKDGKKKFNTLMLKIDKGSRWRIINIAFFFGRRLLTAVLLTLPIDNQYIFLQYVLVLMSSHAYILYLVATKPYQTPLMNAYSLANETFYSALIILIFIFSDATPQLNIKLVAGVALIVAIFLMVAANLAFIAYLTIKGKTKLKEEIKQAKFKRVEKEEKERKEDEERRLEQKRKEEDFSKLPDETNNQSQDVNNTTMMNNNTTLSEMNLKGKKHRQFQNKKKVEDALEDNVQMGSAGSKGRSSGGTGPQDYNETDKQVKRTKGLQKKNTTGSKQSDDKQSRSSQSVDSEKQDRPVID